MNIFTSLQVAHEALFLAQDLIPGDDVESVGSLRTARELIEAVRHKHINTPVVDVMDVATFLSRNPCIGEQKQLSSIENQQEKIVALLKDVLAAQQEETAALVALKTAVNAVPVAIQALKDQIAAGSPATAADLDGIVTAMHASTEDVKSDTTTLEGATTDPATGTGAAV